MKTSDLKLYSAQLNFNEEVLRIALSDSNLHNDKSSIVVDKVSRLLDGLSGSEAFLFNSSKELFNQFCHSCCHALSEHLMYTLHSLDGYEVSHIQIIYCVSIHSCVEIRRGGKVFYLDAGGVFPSIEEVLDRYKTSDININTVDIVRRSSSVVIDEGDCDEVRKLTELTSFWEVVAFIGEANAIESMGDFEVNALNNIAIAILP